MSSTFQDEFSETATAIGAILFALAVICIPGITLTYTFGSFGYFYELAVNSKTNIYLLYCFCFVLIVFCVGTPVGFYFKNQENFPIKTFHFLSVIIGLGITTSIISTFFARHNDIFVASRYETTLQNISSRNPNHFIIEILETAVRKKDWNKIV